MCLIAAAIDDGLTLCQKIIAADVNGFVGLPFILLSALMGAYSYGSPSVVSRKHNFSLSFNVEYF
jgi:hypothetical protein